MKNNMMPKKMLKTLLFLTTWLMVISVNARNMQNQSTSRQGTAQGARRTAQKLRGRPQQRSVQGRAAAARARKQPATTRRSASLQPIPAAIVPSLPVPAPEEQQPVSKNLGITPEQWKKLKDRLEATENSPSEALEYLKKIHKTGILLTPEQGMVLDLFEQRMKLNRDRALLKEQSDELVKNGLADKARQLAIPAGGGPSSALVPQEQKLIPAGDGVDEKTWANIKESLNQRAQSPSPEVVQYIEEMKKNPQLSGEQQEFLSLFQQRMQVAMVFQNQSQQLTTTGSSAKPEHQGAIQQWWNDPSWNHPDRTFLGFRVSNASSPQQQAPAIQPQLNIDPATAKPISQQVPVQTPAPAKPKREGAIQKWWNDPDKTFLGFPVSNASSPQQPASNQNTTLQAPEVKIDPRTNKPILQQVPAETAAPAKPRSQGELGKAWAGLPSLSEAFNYALTGDWGTESQPGKHANKEGWPKLQENLEREAKENASQALVDRIEEIKKYPYFNAQQQNWLKKFQQAVERVVKDAIHKSNGTLTERSWKSLQAELLKNGAFPSQELAGRIEKIKKSPRFSKEQREWLEKYQHDIEAFLKKQAESSVSQEQE